MCTRADDATVNGKTVIVTGANAGIGFETARDLAKRGARVILACRNEGRANAARKEIADESGNENVHVRIVDMTSLKSVRKFADGILREETRLDVLVNNAGAGGLGRKFTEDNIIIGMQVNHFGPFLLTNLLLPLLESTPSSRVINVSSIAHYLGKLRFEDLDVRHNWNDFHSYCVSKLYNVLTANELTRRTKGKVIAHSCHPGVVATNIFSTIPNKAVLKILNVILNAFFKTPEEGAQSVIHLAVSKKAGETGGLYYSDCKPNYTFSITKNPDVGARFWKASEKMVGLS